MLPRGFGPHEDALSDFRWSLSRLGRLRPLVNPSTWQCRPRAHRPWLLLRICPDWTGVLCFSGHQKEGPGDKVWVSVPVKDLLLWYRCGHYTSG